MVCTARCAEMYYPVPATLDCQGLHVAKVSCVKVSLEEAFNTVASKSQHCFRSPQRQRSAVIFLEHSLHNGIPVDI